MNPPADVRIALEQTPSDLTLNAAAQLYMHLTKEDPASLGKTAGKIHLGERAAFGLLKSLALVTGEFYTARDESGELVGFAAWSLPGRSVFERAELLEMGFNKFLANLTEAERDYYRDVLNPAAERFVNESLNMENGERDTYWCYFAMVREDYQNKGICRAMFNIVHQKARDVGAPMALFASTRKNVSNQSWYQVEIYKRLDYNERGRQSFSAPWGEWEVFCLSRDSVTVNVQG
ncbi:hypothetical protein BD414DRAFT_436640 [Trametes punicea]|nr:hypothetical protein BD414DRAFT_436640 [Trametes punicea]